MRNLEPAEEESLWQEVLRRFSQTDYAPSLTLSEVDHILDSLPNPTPGESLIDRIRRADQPATQPAEPFAVIDLDDLGDGSVLLEDTQEIRGRLLQFSIKRTATGGADPCPEASEVFRLAAADSEREADRSNLDCTIESDDGRFRISLLQRQGSIELKIQALGFAADDFASARIVCS